MGSPKHPNKLQRHVPSKTERQPTHSLVGAHTCRQFGCQSMEPTLLSWLNCVPLLPEEYLQSLTADPVHQRVSCSASQHPSLKLSHCYKGNIIILRKHCYQSVSDSSALELGSCQSTLAQWSGVSWEPCRAICAFRTILSRSLLCEFIRNFTKATNNQSLTSSYHRLKLPFSCQHALRFPKFCSAQRKEQIDALKGTISISFRLSPTIAFIQKQNMPSFSEALQESSWPQASPSLVLAP